MTFCLRVVLSRSRSCLFSRLIPSAFKFYFSYDKVIFLRRMSDNEVTMKSETVINEEKEPTEIREGKAVISIGPGERVFYNPVQEFNRDISIATLSLFSQDRYNNRKANKRTAEGEIKKDNHEEILTPGTVYQDGITVLEALSASGLRSVRYAKEIPGIKQIVANDISQSAVKAIQNNIASNNVENLVLTSHSDASLLMYSKRSEGCLFDAIDLDPYGCPSRFLDSAVQAVSDGGVLLVTCTDMAILAGNSPETCYVKYGALSLKSSACHELALRIALQCIESHANRYGRYIKPLLSFSADFYIRLVVQVQTSPVVCKQTTSKLSHVYQCTNCKSMILQPLGQVIERQNKPPKYCLSRVPITSSCQHCQGSLQIGGPIWSGPLFCSDFLQRLLRKLETSEITLSTYKRIVGMLSNIIEEIEVPLYYTVSFLCSIVHCEVIPLAQFRSALLNAGYRVSLSHAAPNSIKTDAPMEVLWDVIRCWVKEHPVAKKRLQDTSSVAYRILNKEPQTKLSFEIHRDALLDRDTNYIRYQVNPTKFWGPGNRATANVESKNKEKTQGKNLKKGEAAPLTPNDECKPE